MHQQLCQITFARFAPENIDRRRPECSSYDSLIDTDGSILEALLARRTKGAICIARFGTHILHCNTILICTGVMNVAMEHAYTIRWHRTPSSMAVMLTKRICQCHS